MIECYFNKRFGLEVCSRRAECVDVCRAGWLSLSVACERCGTYRLGPFMSTIVDDGGDGVVYRFLCPPCVAIEAALEQAERDGYGQVRRLLSPPGEGG